MIEILQRNIIRFIILVLLQIFIFNNIELNIYMSIQFYVLFIIILPFETRKWILLTSSFFLGLCIDIFSENIGMHTISCVFIAFLRPYTLRIFAPREGYSQSTRPTISYYGFSWFLKYCFILVLAHHFVLFYVEVFRFSHFFHTLLRVFMSSIITTGAIVTSQFLVYRK